MARKTAAKADAPANPVTTFTSKIAPELQALARPMTECKPHPDNARQHNLPRIAQSLNAHGQRTPIVVQQSTGYVVKGNGTWTAAAQILGWTEIAQLWQELSDDEAMAYLLADNKASDDAGYDTKKLQSALEKLAAGPGLMESLWDSAELEDMMESAAGPLIIDAPAAAAYADEAYIEDRKTKAASGTKHKEVPLVMTEADHAAFVERLAVLRKAWGTGTAAATIVEAVKRLADMSDEAISLGREPDAEERQRIRRELVVELRDVILTDPRYDHPSRAQIVALLESAAPQPQAPKKPSKTMEAFPQEPEQLPVVSPLREQEDDEMDLAAYRRAIREEGAQNNVEQR